MVNKSALPQAIRIIESHGLTPLNEGVIAQLRNMHPARTEEVRIPSEVEIKEELRENEKAEAKWHEKLDRESESTIPNPQCNLLTKARTVENDDEIQAETDLVEVLRWRLERCARTQVNAESIMRVAGLARSSTRGGVQGITPWVLRQAIEASPRGDLAKLIAALSNRIAKGDFSQVIGKISCVCWTVALWKDEKEEQSPANFRR